MSFRIVLAARVGEERVRGRGGRNHVLARARSVVRSPHARTKLPAVTIIISSSATAEFDSGSIFGWPREDDSLSLARSRFDEEEIL